MLVVRHLDPAWKGANSLLSNASIYFEFYWLKVDRIKHFDSFLFAFDGTITLGIWLTKKNLLNLVFEAVEHLMKDPVFKSVQNKSLLKIFLLAFVIIFKNVPFNKESQDFSYIYQSVHSVQSVHTLVVIHIWPHKV